MCISDWRSDVCASVLSESMVWIMTGAWRNALHPRVAPAVSRACSSRDGGSVLGCDLSIMTPSGAPAAGGAGARRHDYRIAIKQFFLREMASNAIYPPGQWGHAPDWFCQRAGWGHTHSE